MFLKKSAAKCGTFKLLNKHIFKSKIVKIISFYRFVAARLVFIALMIFS